MEQNSQPENTIAGIPETKKSKAPLIGMISLGVLAVAGVAFGVVSLINTSNKSAEISDLKAQIAQLTQNNNANTTIPDGATEQSNSAHSDLGTTISDLKSQLQSKEATIAELQNTISSLQSEANNQNNSVKLILGAKLAENSSNITFKIGECSADGGEHIYIKCPVTTAKGEAMISWHDTDGILRFTENR